MNKLDIAAKHCCSWHSPTRACVFDKACEPEKCSYWPVVERTAAKAAGSKLKGGTR